MRDVACRFFQNIKFFHVSLLFFLYIFFSHIGFFLVFFWIFVFFDRSFSIVCFRFCFRHLVNCFCKNRWPSIFLFSFIWICLFRSNLWANDSIVFFHVLLASSRSYCSIGTKYNFIVRQAKGLYALDFIALNLCDFIYFDQKSCHHRLTEFRFWKSSACDKKSCQNKKSFGLHDNCCTINEKNASSQLKRLGFSYDYLPDRVDRDCSMTVMTWHWKNLVCRWATGEFNPANKVSRVFDFASFDSHFCESVRLRQ